MSDILVIGVLEGEERENEYSEAMFEEMMSKSFLKVIKALYYFAIAAYQFTRNLVD